MEDEWYYCIEHKKVEPRFGCRITTRIGPFPTRAEAAHALQKVQERNEEWQEQDEHWDGVSEGE